MASPRIEAVLAELRNDATRGCPNVSRGYSLVQGARTEQALWASIGRETDPATAFVLSYRYITFTARLSHHPDLSTHPQLMETLIARKEPSFTIAATHKAAVIRQLTPPPVPPPSTPAATVVEDAPPLPPPPSSAYANVYVPSHHHAPPPSHPAPSLYAPLTRLASSRGGLDASTDAWLSSALGAGGADAGGCAARPAASSYLPPRPVDLPRGLIDQFVACASANTASGERGLETCGVLLGRPSAATGGFSVTAVLLPPQTAGPDTCGVEEAGDDPVLSYCLQHDLICLGWVHTHPSQDCFLSSIDLHTSFAYQMSLPEALAVVVAPRDTTTAFRLTPEGMALIAGCDLRGFHAHAVEGLFRQAEGLTGSEGSGVVVDARGGGGGGGS